VLVLVDPETYLESDPQFRNMGNEETASMEHHIIAGLRRLANRVQVLAFDPETAVADLRKIKPDVVFNLVEHIGKDRRRAAEVPTLLRLLGLPYTGCGAMGMSISIDKAVSKHVVAEQGLSVPSFASWPIGVVSRSIKFGLPIIVKPRYGGGSEGISARALINQPKQLSARVKFIHRAFKQDAICEQYIDGREISVGVLGDRDPLLVLPPRETVFGSTTNGGPGFATDRVKCDAAYRKRWAITYQRAELSARTRRATMVLASEAYRHLGMRGYIRVDMRIDKQERPHFLEANANPDLRPTVFGVMASWLGLNYEQLLAGIIELALRR
jgi:D-alanine-D-alanine ligase